ncbi:MAG: hypothetical protein ABDH49_07375 [Candidatus Hydrothermales bacterium]
MSALIIPLILLFHEEAVRRFLIKKSPEIILRSIALNEDIQKEANLSKEEVEFLKSAYFELEKETEKIKSNIKIKEIEIQEIINSEKIDFDKIEKIIKEISNLNEELRLKQIRSFKKVYEKLGSEKFKEIRKILKEYRKEKRRKLKGEE